MGSSQSTTGRREFTNLVSPKIAPTVNSGLAADASTQTFVLILAAGASTRMGCCKAALPWLDGKTLLAYQIEQFRQAGITPIVVLAPHNLDCQPEHLENIQIIVNPRPAEGKTRSVLLGLELLPEKFSAVAISAVDQPRPAWVYKSLREHHQRSNALITAPTYQGQLGHPLFFSYRLRSHLQAIREETLGIRQVVKAFADDIQRVEFPEPLVLLDMNTPEVYQRNYQFYRSLE